MTEGKPEGYYAQTRAELVALLPRPLGRVLDVGCGSGGAAAPLRQRGAERIVGIEVYAPAAELARETYDVVHEGRVEDVLPGLAERFDTILCYDVLEHLVDPAAVLHALKGLAEPGARLHVSVPNARHWTLLRDLAVRGTFGYAPAGHRDDTHLRWFTRADLVRLLEDCGWSFVEAWPGRLRASSQALGWLTRGLSLEFLVYQWAVLAQRS